MHATLAKVDGAPAVAGGRTAIIDIGSNSVRLVVYEALTRAPTPLFNEKLLAGLGRGLAADGKLTRDSVKASIGALKRFAAVVEAIGVERLRVVATAAVRDAANGGAFIEAVARDAGLAVEVIDGETEARAAAYGVISGIPDADGVVGDMGGGSLELVRVAGGEAHERVSLPLGALRLDAARKRGRPALLRFIDDALEGIGWAAAGRGKPFYAVGGSWRALAHLHMALTDWPLPVIHQYAMPPEAPARLVRALARMDPKTLRAVPSIAASRAPQLPGAALLLKQAVARLGSSRVVASAYGLREGLLHMELPAAERAADPLLSAACAEARRSGRHAAGDGQVMGDAMLGWTDALFADEAPELRRLRHAACLLADTAWRAHPDFRAERGYDLALHGNWVGIDAAERAMLAQALHAANGGAAADPMLTALPRLADPALLARARAWGLALRLGLRLAGGMPSALAGTRLDARDGALRLVLSGRAARLHGESVARRHKLLAQALGLAAKLDAG